MGGWVYAVDVQLVEVALDDLLAGGVRYRVAEAAGREAGTDGEDHIALCQEFGWGVSTDSYEERVVFREGTFGFQGCDDGCVQQLGEGPQLGRCAGIDHAFAGIDQRVLCIEHDVCGSSNVRWVGSRLPALDRGIGVGGLVILSRSFRHGQHHRSRPATSQHGKCAAHELRYPRGSVDVPVPLGNGLQARGHVELRVLRAACRNAVSDAQYGRAVLECLGQTCIGDLDAGGVHATLHRAHAYAFTAGHAGEAIRERDGVAVVTHHDHGDALASKGVIHPTHGEGRDPLDSFLLQDFCYGSCDIDGHVLLLFWKLSKGFILI